MRKLFNTLFVIIAAMVTFAGCAKEEVNTPANETKTVQFIAESIETKTAFGTPDGATYPTLWTANDKDVKISLNYASPKDASVTVLDGGESARFVADITDDASGAYVFYALSPAKSYNSFNGNDKYLSAAIPTSQTPLANSADESAQILYAISDQYDEMPGSVAMNFKHFTAYGKLSFVNLNLGEATVQSVAITSSLKFANRWNYMVEQDKFVENSGATTITLNTSAIENLWFACAPVGSMNGQTLTFTINTDKGPLSKEVTLSGDKYKFEAGKIAKMVVDMAGIEFAESVAYDLVTDVAELTAGSKIIIAAKDYGFALSTTQNNNNRAQTAVTKVENTIKDPGSDVQIFTIEAGKQAGTVAFNTGSGYIYAASSGSNHLKTETSLTDNSSWLVTISDGVATIKAQGTNTRNWLRYNSSSSLFSCYSSGQNDVYIYKLPGSGTVLENYLNVSPESIEVDADATSASFTVSSDLLWTATSEDATVTIDGNTVTVTFDANTVEEVKTYTVTVTANGVDPKTVTITQKEYVDTSKIEELTIAEFKEKTVSSAVWYKLTGTVTNITSTTYGNFDLVDETGSVYIYGLTKTQVTSNDKSFASLGIKEGDVVTLITVRGEHNGAVQGGGTTTPAYYVSHMSACAAPVISCADNTVTITAEAGATIYYTKDGTDPSTESDKYDEAFSITETVTVKAIAVAEGKVQSVVASNLCTYVDPNAEQPAVKKYTFTITKDEFNTTSYAANNNEKTSTAKAEDGSTIEVKWTSYQVMNQSSTMQWQKSKGYIYNITDLGTITSVDIKSTAGTFTQYINNAQQPTSDGVGGYFQIKVGSATGKVTSITVTFEK